jgi:hypothetical protein
MEPGLKQAPFGPDPISPGLDDNTARANKPEEIAANK